GIAILMTSTKAAFVTMIMTFMASLFLFPSKRRSLVLFKISFLMLLTMGVALFGGPAFKILYDVTTGKRSFGMRRAQNGIQTRLEEVYRGMEYFQEEPLMGKGLLYKFMSGKGIKVSGYNSFKDPHNLFISAGVIGGWPLLILSVVGYLLMIYGAINGMLSASYDMRIMGIFLFSHLLVFVIYHAHFSLGGMGDRMYWLVFGYLGLNGINGIRQKRRPEVFTKDSTFVMT
ncbi:MAG: O-antigen ligase family protein, partial [Halobacteriovoraceae bacterium]|nr:O-antigen ligase family protein [Halobacteriovoraceae bacterium]